MGSEMCIRDSSRPLGLPVAVVAVAAVSAAAAAAAAAALAQPPLALL